MPLQELLCVTIVLLVPLWLLEQEPLSVIVLRVPLARFHPMVLLALRAVLVNLPWVVLHRVRILAPTAWLENSKSMRW